MLLDIVVGRPWYCSRDNKGNMFWRVFDTGDNIVRYEQCCSLYIESLAETGRRKQSMLLGGLLCGLASKA